MLVCNREPLGEVSGKEMERKVYVLWLDNSEQGLYSHTKLELVFQNCLGIEKLLAVLCCYRNVSIALQTAA